MAESYKEYLVGYPARRLATAVVFERHGNIKAGSFGAHPRIEVTLDRALNELMQGRSLDSLSGLPVPEYQNEEIASPKTWKATSSIPVESSHGSYWRKILISILSTGPLRLLRKKNSPCSVRGSRVWDLIFT